MKGFICFLLGVALTSIMGALCFFCVWLEELSNEYWDKLKKRMDDDNERR